MGVLGDFLSPEAGQKRTKWRNEKADDLYHGLQYYLGPTGVPDKMKAVAELLQFTDAGDVYEAQAGATDIGNARNGWEALAGTGRMLTGMAAAVTPVVGAKMANNLTDAGIDWLGSAVDDVMAGYDPAMLRSGVGPAAKADPATTRGQEILDLLSTNPSAVTDDMLDMGDPVLNARLNEYLWANYDLPMDEASRMARAEGMGFTEDALHGTVVGADFQSFRGPSRYGRWQESYFAPNTEDGNKLVAQFSTADQGRVYPVMIQGEEVLDTARTAAERERFLDILDDNNLRLDWDLGHNGGGFRASGRPGWGNSSVIDAVGRENPAGMKLHERDWVESTAVFDPSKVRSRFARFDPRLAHLRNLNAGLAGGLLFGAMGLTPSEEGELREYLGGI